MIELTQKELSCPDFSAYFLGTAFANTFPFRRYNLSLS